MLSRENHGKGKITRTSNLLGGKAHGMLLALILSSAAPLKDDVLRHSEANMLLAACVLRSLLRCPRFYVSQ